MRFKKVCGDIFCSSHAGMVGLLTADSLFVGVRCECVVCWVWKLKSISSESTFVSSVCPCEVSARRLKDASVRAGCAERAVRAAGPPRRPGLRPALLRAPVHRPALHALLSAQHQGSPPR
jgi:hypothetical protein